jgi:hypothetical protein
MVYIDASRRSPWTYRHMDADNQSPCWPCYREGFDVPPLEECPTLDEVRQVLEAGEEIPYKAHMALDYGGMHPNPEEHL